MYEATPRVSARNQLAHSSWTKWTGLATLVGSISFLVLFTFLGFLRPDYSPVRQAISDLGVGNLDWALNGGVIVTGAILVAFGFAFTQDAMHPVVKPGWRWLLGVLLELKDWASSWPGTARPVGGCSDFAKSIGSGATSSAERQCRCRS